MEKENNQDVTELLNQIYSEEDSTLDIGLESLQFQSLPKEEWE